MTLLTSKKGKLYSITGIIIIILLFLGLYFLYIQPLKMSLANKQRELQTEEKLLSVIENQINDTGSDTYEGSETLQKQLPVKPLVEQLLLDIEKAEVVSGSLVTNMEFSMEEIEEQIAEQQEASEEETPVDQREETKPETPLPAGIKKTTVVLTVNSSNYFEMEKFIDSLESESRIIHVENLQTEGQEEVVSADQEKQLIVSEITISAFYMPKLTDLIDQLPKMDVPKTGGKKNPFSMSGNILEPPEKALANQTQHSNDIKPKTESEGNIIKYTVQPGDSLSRISMSFFQSSAGEQIIKDRNHLNSNVIIVGQVLEIPIQ
ncbi:LysM peptidoglycan-binding domain-containing protein [Cytobacillus depressus]|uniref:LysM peptidoglycan-binding domain-containing protein n=1 Tax=Cytobacillus depressus TaxID=1602942 RepID=A0A6L3VDV7_9BACI|nr:LysM peptidoglycan-binding domain-containing protein [Cytobacillus depressus]KAB2338717.1 LysM peptidoglycan-binding domain-containing protein [Cytobacillus depressus]